MISKEEIKKLGELSRLGINEEEMEILRKNIAEILDYFSQLKEVDAGNTADLVHPLEIENALREDREKLPQPEESKMLVDSAPIKKDDYIKVKKIFNR